MTNTDLSQIQTYLTSAKQILVLTSQTPTMDGLAASLSLYLSLLAAGKKVNVACASQTTVEFNRLVGIDKITSDLPSGNFVISLDYVEGAIEKVSYNILGDKFNLVIEPKVGAPAFSPDKVKYSAGSAAADLIFVLDCPSLEQLGKFYTAQPDLFSKTTVLNLDYHQNNNAFGKINLVDPTAFSVSEIVAFFLKNLGLTINEDIATNLLTGMISATDNFSVQKSGPGSFEAAGVCLRNGGKRETAAFVPMEHLDSGEPKQAPADWLQPKIFSSKSNPTPTPSGESTTI